MKPRLYILVKGAEHFLQWELPFFEQYFEIVDAPSKDAVLFAFGPDVMVAGAEMPALKRVVYILPGFHYYPYFDRIHYYGMSRIIDEAYDLILANPGAIEKTFEGHPRLRICPFAVDITSIKVKRYRTQINSLLHASAPARQKDWTRSRDVMRHTGLPHEVFPPREKGVPQYLWTNFRLYLKARGLIKNAPLLHRGYEAHATLIAKYHEYDGFVHIAAPTPPYYDGKYTATLFEAGLTGAILFWHDTHGHGNDFETIFDLPLEPEAAAREIMEIRRSIDVEAHSRRTVEEIHERLNPAQSIRIRYDAIMEMLA